MRTGGVLVSCLAAIAAILTSPFGTVTTATADTLQDQQRWVLDAVHAPAAWQVTYGRGATVAVIDSGVVGSVSDLVGSVIRGRDFTGLKPTTSPSDSHWGIHGTWMASLIAGHGHGSKTSGNLGTSGILGVAPAARILSIRVLADRGDPGYHMLQRENGDAAQRALAKAIVYAADRGAAVISMSLGNGAPSRRVRQAIQFALDHNVVVVASSGNSGDSASARRQHEAPYLFPADYPGVLGVGAVNQFGQPTGFSSANLSVQVAAPGAHVPAQGRDGQYWLVSGTSPACALTAGVAALIKARYPKLAPALVVRAITATAQNGGKYSEKVGFGTVDAAAALVAAGRLSGFRSTGRGVAVSAHFGGGPGAVPVAPVAPRGKGVLLAFALLAVVCLAGVIAVAARIVRLRRSAAPYDPSESGNRLL